MLFKAKDLVTYQRWCEIPNFIDENIFKEEVKFMLDSIDERLKATIKGTNHYIHSYMYIHSL